MFPNPKEQQAKLALLGLAGAIGNILGLVLAGVWYVNFLLHHC